MSSADQTHEPDTDEPGVHYVPVRRRPDLARFLIIGAVVGFIGGGLVGYFGPRSMNSSILQEVILLGLVGVLVAVFFAAIAYLLADRLSQRG